MKKRILSLILSFFIMACGILSPLQPVYTVHASALAGAALAAGETLQFISAVMAAGGVAISVKELLKPVQTNIEKDIGKSIDWDNYDWGDLLDSPSTQSQIDQTEEKVKEYYDNAVKDWVKNHQGSSETTPSPEPTPTSGAENPPVTVAPIDPDTVTPPDWDTLKNNSLDKGFLALGAATFACLKNALDDFLIDIFDNEKVTQDSSNHFSGQKFLGKVFSSGISSSGSFYQKTSYCYLNPSYNFPKFKVIKSSYGCYSLNAPDFSGKYRFDCYTISSYSPGKTYVSNSQARSSSDHPDCDDSSFTDVNSYFISYIPYTLDGVDYPAMTKPLPKPAILPSTDTKSDYDNNKAPSADESPAPAIILPTLEDLKNLLNQHENAEDDDKPAIVTDFLTSHYTDPTTDPEPTTAPDPDPQPTIDPENPDITVTPDPENPDVDDGDPMTDYKTDLRLVFPFCIPFDLIHLIKAFDAEPQAPVFEFPVDIEFTNPFNQKKILDYHETFKLDMSDYEDVIKILRIFEVIFFIIGLLMITRQHMIKG
ncbi:MAG: hypothetical protein PUI16_02660 [Clostridia bacterium]|nr:hypothetical protein [Clostridia bacterium]MDY5555661.1 hypothetical protein [Blautia sp.]